MKSKKDKNKSSITTYTTVAVGILLMLCACFTFLIFSTDTLYNIETGELANHDSLFNRTDVTTVIETVIVDESGAGDNNDIPVDIPIAFDSWYTPVTASDVTSSTEVVETLTLSTGAEISIYRGMPFDLNSYSGTVYYFALGTAKKDVETWWGSGDISRCSWDYMYNSNKNSLQQYVYYDTSANPIGENSSSSSDIVCLRVNLSPCFVTNNYNDGFKDDNVGSCNWINKATTDDTLYGASGRTAERPIVLAVRNKKNNEIGFLPVEPWAKAHTWPGGLFQTQVSIGKYINETNTTTTFTVDTGDWGGEGWGHFHDTTKDNAWSDYQTWNYYDRDNDPCSAYLKISYELANGNKDDINLFDESYEVLGSYIWR